MARQGTIIDVGWVGSRGEGGVNGLRVDDGDAPASMVLRAHP